MPKEQLCWTCQNACGGCLWSASLTPIKGWIAIKTRKKDSHNGIYDAYHIDECPQYTPDNPPKPKRKQGKGLTSDEKKLILDFYNEGKTITEIASLTNVSRNTVMKYCKKL